MNIPAKVLWGEGLFLRPQHFQQQDRYHEARLNETSSALHPYCWGVRRLAIDTDALKADTLRVTDLALIPGTVGAAPIQNIGAYGAETKDYFLSLTAFDPASGDEIGRASCRERV